MAVKILITDDSGFARKQLARALPSGWDVEVSFAENGKTCLEAIREGKGEVLFLDLNMPVMDGYGVLEEIRRQDLPTLSVVVSGDVQPEARRRVKELGALDFIRKPIDQEVLAKVLDEYGILTELTLVENATPTEYDIPVDLIDCYQEVANIAMGNAGDRLARLLGVFFHQPIPRISILTIAELSHYLYERFDHCSISAVSQGFVGSRVAGEAILIFEDAVLPSVGKLIRQSVDEGEAQDLEMLVTMASLVIGASLSSVERQLDLDLSLGLPGVVVHKGTSGMLLADNEDSSQRVLLMDISYLVEDSDVQCTLFLMFTGDSLTALDERVSYFIE